MWNGADNGVIGWNFLEAAVRPSGVTFSAQLRHCWVSYPPEDKGIVLLGRSGLKDPQWEVELGHYIKRWEIESKSVYWMWRPLPPS